LLIRSVHDIAYKSDVANVLGKEIVELAALYSASQDDGAGGSVIITSSDPMGMKGESGSFGKA
jgi:hypothetical protein